MTGLLRPAASGAARRPREGDSARVSDAYPATRSARDRYVLSRRPAVTRPDAGSHHGVLVEDELCLDGRPETTATVFLTGRECPWRCVMCDLWQHTTIADTPGGAIPSQIASAVAHLRQRGDVPAVVKLYNAGSFFDRRAVPEQDDAAIVETLGPFRHVIVESHPALVGSRTWRLRDALAARGAQLEVAMGLETAHPQALDRLNKGVTVDRVATAAEALREHGVLMRAFLLIHPPFVPSEQQRLWLSRSVAWADACRATAVSLIPTRDGEGALRALADAGHFSPPRLLDIETAAADARRTAAARVFVDLWDLARFATCPACAESRTRRLRAFNLSQSLPPVVHCPSCGEASAA